MAKERTCIACKTNYTYCPNCSRADSLKEAWHTEFCSKDCKVLWHTATGYNANIISKEEAKKIISDLNLKNKEQYVACLQRDLDNIMIEKKPAPAVQKTVKATVAPKAAKTSVVEKTETIIAPKKAEIVHEVVNKTEEK